MKAKKVEVLNKSSHIIAEIYARDNFLNGKYKAGHLGLENLVEITHHDTFLIETLKMKADLADKMIADAEGKGRDTNDPDVMRELGKEINAKGEPVHKNESTSAAISVSLHLIVYYGIAIGIWGLVFKQNFLTFVLYGAIVGLLISLLSVAPVIASQRTKERIGDMVFSTSSTCGNTGIIIGIFGIIALVIRLIFFK